MADNLNEHFEEFFVSEDFPENKPIALIGEIQSINNDSIILSFEGKTITVSFKSGLMPQNLNQGMVVRVFGVFEQGFGLNAETAHELKGFDFKLFKEVKKIESSIKR